jgi:hypothetical protein
MPFAINQQWLNVTSFDSGAPSQGAAVVHRFGSPGEYRVTFLAGEASLAQTLLAVTHQTPSKAAAPGHVTLDLTKVAYPPTLGAATSQREHVVVSPDGYVSFTNSGKPTPFAVVVHPMGEKSPAFDTRRLGPGDLFAVTLIRPGEYRVRNELEKAEGRIRVAYPVVGDRPYRPPEPLSVECGGQGFRPAQIDVKPAQGLIFQVQTVARIRIDLTHPDDGPGEEPAPRASYSREALAAALERLREARKKS